MVTPVGAEITGTATTLLTWRSWTAFHGAPYTALSLPFSEDFFKFITQRVVEKTFSFFMVYLITIFVVSLYSVK
jgi:hypothetical protein